MRDILDLTTKNPIIPVVKIAEPANACEVAKALYAGGIHCMEITFRTAGAAEAIRNAVSAQPGLLVGAGTVVNETQVDEAVEAGAEFIVSPGFSQEVVRRCMEADICCLPGCITPSEIMMAQRMGLKAVKFFPAETSGGVKALKALAAPFPALKFIPTGGINSDNVEEYLNLPCVAACGGSWMVSERDIEMGNFAEIRDKSARAMEKVVRR